MLLDKNNINNEFVDQSWEHMSSMLDREMPVNKKDNRKFVLLFLFASLFFFAGLFTQKYALENKTKSSNKENHSPIQVSNDVALLQNKTNEFSTNIITKEKDIPSDIIAANIPSTSLNTINSNAVQNSIAKNSNANNSNDVLSNDLKKGNSFTIAKKEQTQLVSHIDELRDLEIDPISSLSLNELRHKTSKLALDIKPLVLTQKRFIDRFNLEVGPETVGTSNMDFIGYGGMINMGFNVTDNITFNVGATLNRFDRLNKVVTYDAVTFVAPVSPEYQELNDNLTSHYDNLNRFVDLSFPIGIEYYAHDRISFNGGMIFRSSIYKEIQGYALHIQNTNNRIEKNYEKNFVNPYIGIGYNLNQNFSINFNYEHGTKSIINTSLYPDQQSKLSILKLSMSLKLL